MMPRLRAWEQLNDHAYCNGLGMVAYHNLLLRAGYSEASAQEAANRHGWNRLQAGVAM